MKEKKLENPKGQKYANQDCTVDHSGLDLFFGVVRIIQLRGEALLFLCLNLDRKLPHTRELLDAQDGFTVCGPGVKLLVCEELRLRKVEHTANIETQVANPSRCDHQHQHIKRTE